MSDEQQGSRPDAPTTAAEIERSLRVIQLAIAGAIITIVAVTIAFVAGFDAPAVPLVPIAALVVIVDIAFVISFTRQRRRALEQLRRRELEAS